LPPEQQATTEATAPEEPPPPPPDPANEFEAGAEPAGQVNAAADSPAPRPAPNAGRADAQASGEFAP
jgi:hypothetical protein